MRLPFEKLAEGVHHPKGVLLFGFADAQQSGSLAIEENLHLVLLKTVDDGRDLAQPDHPLSHLRHHHQILKLIRTPPLIGKTDDDILIPRFHCADVNANLGGYG